MDKIILFLKEFERLYVGNDVTKITDADYASSNSFIFPSTFPIMAPSDLALKLPVSEL
jgi:hypothetical protein